MIGILGGGQLGRMLALAGYPLGLSFRFLDPSPEAYREHHVLGPESILSPTAFPEFPVPVASLL